MTTISVNVLARSEPFLCFGISSIARFADEIIIMDSGSEPKYIRAIEKLMELHSNIRLEQFAIENAQGWVFDQELSRQGKFPCRYTHSNKTNKKLGDLRRLAHSQSKGEVIWLLDGDEIYGDEMATAISNYIHNTFTYPSKQNYVSIHLPFMDFIDCTGKVRLLHSMGRIFKRLKTECKQDFLEEMHCDLEGKVLTTASQNNINILYTPNSNLFVYHMGPIVKPWRRKLNINAQWNGPWPEVFERLKIYPEIYDLIRPFGF